MDKTARQGRIHRTDVWSGGRRCLVADLPGSMGCPRKTGKAGRQGQRRIRFTIGSLQLQLRRYAADIAHGKPDRELARGVPCDYCFFGGPTRLNFAATFHGTGRRETGYRPNQCDLRQLGNRDHCIELSFTQWSVNVVVTSSDTTVLQVDRPWFFQLSGYRLVSSNNLKYTYHLHHGLSQSRRKQVNRHCRSW